MTKCKLYSEEGMLYAEAELDNEGHQEMEQMNHFMVINDETTPSGRWQISARVWKSGEIVLSGWHQHRDGNWYSTECMSIKQGGLRSIIKLFRQQGYDDTISEFFLTDDEMDIKNIIT